ncbi:hypothetical protein RRF57_013230 [Xylaria bambusicola]|uniref:Uncharacterized protein n=1 Tax=Xylaria bambusicola TaxID=326684 RepID=A0AAN7URC4_9PEZI
MLSMVHPAFRPNASHIAASALPAPLNVRKKCEPAASQPGGHKAMSSVWTDCTAYTLGEADSSSIPPVPRIPSEYRLNKRSSDSDRQGSSPRVGRASSGYSRQTSTTSFPRYEDPFMSRAESVSSSSSSTKAKRKSESKNPVPDWPAPPHGHPPDSLRHQGPFLPQSDIGSAMSEQRHAFLVERFQPKEEALQERNSMTTNHSQYYTHPNASGTQPQEGSPGIQRASSSIYSRTSVASFAKSEKETGRDGSGATSQSMAAAKGAARAQQGVESVRDDTPRNTRPPWLEHPPPPSSTAHASSAITQFGNFQGRM